MQKPPKEPTLTDHGDQLVQIKGLPTVKSYALAQDAGSGTYILIGMHAGQASFAIELSRGGLLRLSAELNSLLNPQ